MQWKGASSVEFEGNPDESMIRIFQCRETFSNTAELGNKYIEKNRTVRIRDPSRKVDDMSKVV